MQKPTKKDVIPLEKESSKRDPNQWSIDKISLKHADAIVKMHKPQNLIGFLIKYEPIDKTELKYFQNFLELLNNLSYLFHYMTTTILYSNHRDLKFIVSYMRRVKIRFSFCARF